MRALAHATELPASRYYSSVARELGLELEALGDVYRQRPSDKPTLTMDFLDRLE